MPASTGTQGKNDTSQRGVMPDHCGRVFVALASWRAADSLSVRRTSGSAVIGFSSKRRRNAPFARTTAEPSEGHYGKPSQANPRDRQMGTTVQPKAQAS